MMKEQLDLSKVRKVTEKIKFALLPITTAPSFNLLDSQIRPAVTTDFVKCAPVSEFGISPALSL